MEWQPTACRCAVIVLSEGGKTVCLKAVGLHNCACSTISKRAGNPNCNTISYCSDMCLEAAVLTDMFIHTYQTMRCRIPEHRGTSASHKKGHEARYLPWWRKAAGCRTNISGFCSYVDEIRTLLGCYALSSCTPLPTFRDNVSVRIYPRRAQISEQTLYEVCVCQRKRYAMSKVNTLLFLQLCLHIYVFTKVTTVPV
jgi:hypothetical protein